MSESPRMQSAYKKFFHAMLHGGVISLATAAYELLGWPINICDHASNSICQIPKREIGIPDWDYLLREKMPPPEHFLDFYNNYISHPETRKFPMLVNDGYLSKTPQIIGLFMAKGKLAGTVAIHVLEREATEEDFEIVRMLCSALSAEFSNQDEQKLYPNIQKLMRFTNILTAEQSSPTVQRDIDMLSAEIWGDYALIISKWDTSKYDDRVSEYLCNEIMRAMPGALAILQDGYLVTLCSGLTESSGESQTVQNALDILSKYSLISSVSAPFSDLRKIRSSYNQTLLTIRLGTRIAPNKILHQFSDYAPLQVFEPAVENYPLDAFLDPLILTMGRYDRKNNSEYVKTLEAYVLSGLNNKQAAARLNVHINTLIYRINRMKELFSIDFSNSTLVTTLICNFLLITAADYPDLLAET